ncbi:hypothetical protein HNP60_000989 [Sphingobium sp. B1D3A]|uniref:Uncharacterized protein n=1 Tax=Sphingobium lignivorans TaxID=2735886 RepID=A0ABR6NCL3_9SPHN|nr:hypothetical protein [Sphingobium lignivorans]
MTQGDQRQIGPLAKRYTQGRVFDRRTGRG